jgi:fused signal recognition particle receptor
MEQSTSLVKIVNESGLEKTKADYILEKFQDYFQIAADWETKARALVVTDEKQVAEMKMAREGRLFLQKKRIAIENSRKELKAQSLREGKAIDGIASVLKGLIEPIENYLEMQEKFVEIKRDKEQETIKLFRISELMAIGIETPIFYDLKKMSEHDYQELLAEQKLIIQQRAEAEQRAEQERIAREAEHVRIKTENDRLKAEAVKREAELSTERAAVAEKMLIEQHAKEKAETELKDKLAAEAAEAERINNERLTAERAPDKEKLLEFARKIQALEFPLVTSPEATKVLFDIQELIAKISNSIIEWASRL